MLGRLVHTITSDGVRLHGFLTNARSPMHAWLFVHGVNSNFYSSSLLQDLAMKLLSSDTSVLLINTRGHDILSFNSGPTPVRTGAQVENIGASALDLDAWFQFLASEGFGKVTLLGHSLGALKSTLWSRKESDMLDGLVAISPPRLNTELLLKDPKRGPVFLRHLQDARAKCEAGESDEVMKVRFPLPMWISASAYLDKYGSGDRYDYMSMVADIAVPTLWTFGEFEVREGSANFLGADIAMRTILASQSESRPSHEVQVIENADHSYRGVTSQLADCIVDWASRKDSRIDR